MLKKLASIRSTLAAVALLLGLAILYAPNADSAVRYPDRGRAGLSPRLVSILYQVERNFGRHVFVVSGCRSRAHNRRIGGARESYHLRCMAADIFVPGVGKYHLWRYLFTHRARGGLGTYCRASFIHVDVGPRREWAWGCGQKSRKRVRLRRA